MKKLLLYVVLLMTVGCAMLGCSGYEYFYEGDYYFYVDYKNDYAILLDVKNSDNLKVLEVPLTAKGVKVGVIGGTISLQNYQIVSESIIDIHIPHTVYSISSGFKCKNLERVFVEKCISFTSDLSTTFEDFYTTPQFFVAPFVFEEYKAYYLQKNSSIVNHLEKANVMFWYNYENSPNLGLYSLDNIDQNNSIKKPNFEPIRVSYKFCGWYLDVECTKKYNFDSQINEVINELNLYAKWENKV